jgi:hypothetical protein
MKRSKRPRKRPFRFKNNALRTFFRNVSAMPLHPVQRRYLNRFYPGLIAAVEQLGAASYEATPPQFKTERGAIRYATLTLNARLTDGYRIEITVQLSMLGGRTYLPPPNGAEDPIPLSEWKYEGYSQHYGTPTKGCEFRFDLDDPQKHHVHMRPNTDLHIPAADVVPDTRDIDPRDFVRIVAKYRADKVYPAKRIR